MQDKEPTNLEILQAVHNLGTQVQGLGTQVAGLNTQVVGMDKTVEGLGTQVAGFGSRTGSLEKTTEDILQAINDYATHNDHQWQKNDERWQKNEERWQKNDECWQKNDERLTRIEALMVTKDYLDDKLADFKGDLIVLMRKEDAKLGVLVAILKKRNVINEADEQEILAMQPFPRLTM